MKPQDILILLKIISLENKPWSQITLASELFMSQSEISQSITRSKFSGLLHITGKLVHTASLMEFLQYGIRFVFPQRPGPVVRGVPTAHSTPPLNTLIRSEESYVWPSARGTVRGHSITPLYKSAVDAVKVDEKLHMYLALVDALRVGKAREKDIAIAELKKQILDDIK